jgi:hypothetical protein
VASLMVGMAGAYDEPVDMRRQSSCANNPGYDGWQLSEDALSCVSCDEAVAEYLLQ